MSTISQKINQVSADKEAIRIAIENRKGASLTEPNNLGTYAPEINNLPLTTVVNTTAGGDKTVWDMTTYDDNMNTEEILRIAGATLTTLKITGNIEQGNDFIKVYDKDGALLNTYTGQLDTEMLIQGSLARIVFTSSPSVSTGNFTAILHIGDKMTYDGLGFDEYLAVSNIDLPTVNKVDLNIVANGAECAATGSRLATELHEQQNLEPNWTAIKNSSLSVIPVEIPLDVSTTSTQLSSTVEFESNSKLTLCLPDNSTVDGQIGVVTFNDPLYQADITSFGLAESPTKAFFDHEIKNTFSIEPTTRELLAPTNFPFIESTTTSYVGDLGAVQRIISSDTNPFNDGSLVSKYLFNDSVSDITGNYSMTINGTANYIPGSETKYISTPTLNDYLSIASLGAWFAGRTDLTVAFFAKPMSDSAGIGHTFHVGYTSHGDPYYTVVIYIKTDAVTITIGNGYNISSDSTTFDINTFYHIAVTITGGTAKMYIDGVLQSSELAIGNGGALNDTNSTVTLGRLINVNNSSNACTVDMDNLEIYNRALTQDEINMVYNQTSDTSYVLRGDDFLKSGDKILLDGSTIPVEILSSKQNDAIDVSNLDPFNDSSLIAKYKMDGDADDLIGNYTGSNFGGNFLPAKFNNGLYSNGTDSYTTTNIPFSDGITISFFAKDGFAISNEHIEDTLDRFSVFGTYDNAAGSLGIYSKSRNGSGVNGDYKYRSLSVNNLIGDFVHIVVSMVTPDTYTLYVNGELHNFTLTETSGTLLNPQGFLTFGRYNYNGTMSYMDGIVDQIDVFNRELTVTEVLKMYNQVLVASGTIVTFPEQVVAPTSAVLPARLEETTIKTKVFDGTKFNIVYNDIINLNTRYIKQLIFIEKVGTKLMNNFSSDLYTNDETGSNISLGTPTVTINDNTLEPTITVSGDLSINNTLKAIKRIEWKIVRSSDGETVWTKTSPFNKKTVAVDYGFITDGVEYSFEAKLVSDGLAGSWGSTLHTPNIANIYVFNMEYGNIKKESSSKTKIDDISSSNTDYFGDTSTDGVSLFEMDYYSSKTIKSSSSVNIESYFTGDTSTDGVSLFEMDYIVDEI